MLKFSNLYNKRVIIRTDYNVPIDKNIITSTKRIDESIDTLNFILNQNPKQIIIISHMGRPKSKNDKELTLYPVKTYLESKLNRDIFFSKDLEFERSHKIILLENIRLYLEETKNISTTIDFQNKLTNLGDVFVNDAFGCCHRGHSSIIGINTSEKYLGFLVEKELKYLKNVFDREGNYSLILGGSKISDKIKLIKNLIPKVNNIIIGGGMAFTFLKYKGYNIGNSIFDEDGYENILEILNYAKDNKTELIFPIDFICNNIFSNKGSIIHRDLNDGILDNYMGLDIGEKSIIKFKNILSKSDTIIWNGPLGVFEFDNFCNGSREIMKYISSLDNCCTIIGGGDTAACCEKFNCQSKMTHVSTGGGASLELLEGKILPGIKFIER